MFQIALAAAAGVVVTVGALTTAFVALTPDIAAMTAEIDE